MMPDTSLISDPETEKRPGRVERRKTRTRAALIEAARRLFAANGIESTSIARIADEADIAVGSFYNYFETKDDLLAALLEVTFEDHLEALRSRQATVDDAAEKVAIAHRHLVEVVSGDPDLGWLIIRFEMQQQIGSHVLSEAARKDIAEGISAGRFQVENSEVSLQASGGALFAVIHAMLLNRIPADCGSEHAAGILMSLGIEPDEAKEISKRPLPPVGKISE